MSDRLRRIEALIHRYFVHPQTRVYGPYRFSEPGGGREILHDTLFQFIMFNQANQLETLQVFTGLNSVGGRLWEQEVSALLSLGARRHSAFPRIRRGAHLDVEYSQQRHGIGYVFTEAGHGSLDEAHWWRDLRRSENKSHLLRQFSFLLDALSLMHKYGLMHRNLWPGTIDVREKGDEGRLELRLGRFEMSTLLTNLVRQFDKRHHVSSVDEEIRQLRISEGPRALACAPPERLAVFFPEGRPSMDTLQDGRSDVFGLGVLGYQFFVGDLPEHELDLAFGSGEGPKLWQHYNGFLRALEFGITRSGLPLPLQDLLKAMIKRENRITSLETMNLLTRHYDAIAGAFEQHEVQRPLKVTYRESGGLAAHLRRWTYITNDPENPAGALELKAFIEDDLRAAVLVYSPNGYEPHGQEQTDAHRAAKYVLGGRQLAYYGNISVRNGERFPEFFELSFVHQRHYARILKEAHLTRRLPPVEGMPRNPRAFSFLSVRQDAKEGEKWTSWLKSVEWQSLPPLHHEAFQNALEWLLQYHRARLASGLFPFVRRTLPGAEFAELEYDWATDLKRSSRDPLLSLINRELRPLFDEYFLALEGGEGLFIRPDSAGGPDPKREHGIFVEFAGVRNQSTVMVQRKPEHPEIPERGWLQSREDLGEEVALRRQVRAVAELLGRPDLLDQLHQPTAMVQLKRSWAGATRGMDGDEHDPSKKIVRDMLDSWPFYALHGPPGTGKTLITSRVISTALKRDPYARFLVSAQSHFALDNLALRIKKELEDTGRPRHRQPERQDDLVLVRIASAQTEDRVDVSLQGHLPASLTTQRLASIRRNLEARLDTKEPPARKRNPGRQGPSPEKQLLGEYRAMLDELRPELQERLVRGANLVWATAGSATAENLQIRDEQQSFEWVFIEEAAKAWPTELAIPLVRGQRWTLIGDHQQLSAYRFEEVAKVLKKCAESDDPELKKQGDRAETYLEIYKVFERIFERKRDEGALSPEDAGLRDPRGRLRYQRRMAPPIATVVSEAFYQGDLKTAAGVERSAGLRRPSALAGKHLVWIDTGRHLERREGEPRWCNRLEFRIIQGILEDLDPELPKRLEDRVARLAILSPYRAQHSLLKELLPAFRENVHTVDSFQGREADIVLLSLVRCNEKSSTAGRLGFLQSPQRVNVLMSRARCLLVLIGDLSHFESSDVQFWKTIVKGVRRDGVVLEPEKVVAALAPQGRGGRS